jgi:(2Fe-2S) ferredoxin
MDETARYRAYLCCGPNCTLRRSLPLVALLQREVARAGLSDRVEVLSGGCMKHCETGPSLIVWPGPVYYQGVTAERLRAIVAQHFGQDRPVAEFFWREEDERAHERRQPVRSSAPSSTPPPRRPPPAKKRPGYRPSWRSDDGDADDFKW